MDPNLLGYKFYCMLLLFPVALSPVLVGMSSYIYLAYHLLRLFILLSFVGNFILSIQKGPEDMYFVIRFIISV